MKRAMRTMMGYLSCALLVALWPQAAASLPVFGGAGAHDIFFKDAEKHVDLDTSGTITVGDKFFGILNAQDIDKGGDTLWTSDNVADPGIDTITGYFVSLVTGVSAAGAGGHTPGLGGTESHIDFGPVGIGGDPNGIFTAAELAAGAVMKIFADDSITAGGPGTPYKTSGGPALGAGSDIANATDGILLAVLGIDAGGGYSYAHGPTSLVLGTVGKGWLGLRFLYKDPSLPGFENINDPLESESNQNVHFYATTEIEVNPGVGFSGNCGLWQLCTNDPAVLSVSEPAGLFSFGLMLVGLGLFSRRMLGRA